MITIRYNTFETNSSSTHSICIPNKCSEYTHHVNFRLGEFGWEFSMADPASYLYTAICNLYEDTDDCNERTDKLQQLKDILDKYDVEYRFEPIVSKPCSWNPKYINEDIGYIDHGCELYSMTEALLANEDLLMRYLTVGEIYTGNDNGDGYETFTDAEGIEHNVCEYAYYEPDPENYTYFYKGN